MQLDRFASERSASERATTSGRRGRGTLQQRSAWRRTLFLLTGIFVVVGLLAIVSGDDETRMRLGAGGDPTLDISSRTFCLGALLVVALAALAIGLRARSGSMLRGAAVGVAVVAMLGAVFAWAARNGTVNVSGTLALGVGAAIPIMLGSSAGVLGERSGVINVAIEAELLAGAFAGALVGSVTDSVWIGLAASIAAGVVTASALAVVTLRFGGDQIVTSIVLIALMLGLTGFLTEQVLDRSAATLNSPPVFSDVSIPVLERLPVVGPALFAQNLLFYVAVAAAIGVDWTLRSTRVGLRIRAAGESPEAAESSGINVRRLRYGAVLSGGAIAGVGGAYFTLGSSGQFVAGMTQGLGFVALASVIVGAWRATAAAAAALMFGFAISLATVFGMLEVDVSPALLLALPYAVTIVIASGVVVSGRAPAAAGKV